jgi:hypothetical protein
MRERIEGGDVDMLDEPEIWGEIQGGWGSGVGRRGD